ncbi:MAG: hypothetical protein Q9210_003650, partial [Variospora velana]
MSAATTTTPSGGDATSAQREMSTVSETREETLEEGEAEGEELRYADFSQLLSLISCRCGGCRVFSRITRVESERHYTPRVYLSSPLSFYMQIKIPSHTSSSSTLPKPTTAPAAHPSSKVGINLTDSTYRGFYNHHSQPIHPPDIDQVLARATSVGVRKFLITGSDLKQSSHAINLAKQYPGQCYATVGVHPCSAMAFEKAAGDGGGEALLEELRTMAQKGKEEGWVKAFGEIGLDYDRLHFCKKEVQEKWFKRQLDVAVD